MPEKTMLIVNPVAGKGRVREELLNILMTLDHGGHGIPVFITEKRGDAAFFVVKYGKKYDRVICTGGDGTLGEVVTGLMMLSEEDRPVLGYIPLGTGNFMADNLNIPGNSTKAAELILSAEPKPLDVGVLGDKYFNYVAAFGAFTEISYETPQNIKNNLGFLAYLLLALNSLPKITPFHARVEYDDKYFDGDFIFGAISNSTTVANIIHLNPDEVELDDGLFEVLLIRTPRNVAELNRIIGNVLARNYNNKKICLFHSDHIKFIFDDRVPWTVDGEDGGVHSVVEANNLHNAIRMLY